MVYSTQDFLSDARGYGHVLAAFRNRTPLSSGTYRPHSHMEDGKIRAFNGSMYAYVRARSGLVAYRWFDDDKGSFLGGWWSPQRPSPEIDGLQLEGIHKRSREHLAIKKDWNEMAQILEAEIRPGTILIVGRAASQFDSCGRLPGGAMQFLVPRDSFGGLHLRRKHQRH
jgi:hypothetical protein